MSSGKAKITASYVLRGLPWLAGELISGTDLPDHASIEDIAKYMLLLAKGPIIDLNGCCPFPEAIMEMTNDLTLKGLLHVPLKRCSFFMSSKTTPWHILVLAALLEAGYNKETGETAPVSYMLPVLYNGASVAPLTLMVISPEIGGETGPWHCVRFKPSKDLLNSIGREEFDMFSEIAFEGVEEALAGIVAMSSHSTKIVKDAPSEKVQAKRARQGKPPLYERWTLTVPGARGSGVSLGGTHASPRLHWRRGTICTRRIGDNAGKKWWRAPSLVGRRDLGVVEKDYKVKIVD